VFVIGSICRLIGANPTHFFGIMIPIFMIGTLALPFYGFALVSLINTTTKLQFVEWIKNNCQPKITTGTAPVMRGI
jgi:hypothetical protein